MKDRRLIHFFGPDGAGKTTQVIKLMDFLREKGVRARKCWVRSPHTLAYVLWKLFAKIGFCRVIWNPFGIGIRIPAVDRNWLLRMFWSIVEFVSVLPHIIRTNLILARGYTLVAERYILDTIVTVAFFINDINFLGNPLAKALILLIPKDAVLIFVNADFTTIYERRKPIFLSRKLAPENPKKLFNYGYVPNSAVEPQEFIEFQRKAYGTLAKSLGAIEICTPKFSVEETFSMILQYLEVDQ